MQDGENILSELLFGAVAVSAENHDFAAVSLNLPPDKVGSKSRKPVFMGNHKTELSSSVQSFQ